MLTTLFKKSFKSKLFILLFTIFTLASGVFVGFPLMVSLANGFTIQMINNVMWTMMFCVFMVVLLIILLVLKTIIFDKDLDFLIKVEIQYQISKTKIYFYRFLVLLTYAYIYITFCLICYFIYIDIFVQGKMNLNIFLTATVGYVAFLYIFVLGTIAILFLITFIKNTGFKFSLPFIILLPFIGMTINSQFFLAPNANVSFQSFIAIEQDMLIYQKFQTSNILDDYSDCFNNNILNQEIENIFPENQLHDFEKYSIFFKQTVSQGGGTIYQGEPNQINYNKKNRTITDVYWDFFNKTNDFRF
ncbi:hypothetical protein [Spiroplasma endosymbiont of Nebria brevicollis]|uniref:hypothetical protein n=1 Tax=Spiroplasma endosymbiont of Nebria brevicollis TaxID=3066284 RepID=UPI00313E59CB